MRTITLIIIHCSAVKPWQQSGVREIDRWHRAKGWKSCGYHYVVRRDGTVEVGRPVEEVGAHCLNRNRHSIGICYEGGLDAEGRPASCCNSCMHSFREPSLQATTSSTR